MASYKKLNWTEADVRCPFYKDDNRALRTISCEGFSAGADVSAKFRSLAQRDRHMGIYCVAGYEKCPLYKCTYDAKYREDDA